MTKTRIPAKSGAHSSASVDLLCAELPDNFDRLLVADVLAITLMRNTDFHVPLVVSVGSSRLDLGTLRGIVAPLSWEIVASDTWQHAIGHINAFAATVFLYDYDANPVEWKEALNASLLMCDRPPAFVMISRLADERLWADVLNRAGTICC